MRGNSVVSKKLAAAAAIVTATALALAGCSSNSGSGSSASPSSSDPFNVVMVLPVTGALNGYATAQKQAMTAAIDYVNKNGGIDGRQAKLTVLDDKLDPTTAVTLLTQQIQTAKPDLVWPGATSNESLAILPVLTRYKILSIGNTQSDLVNDPTKWPYEFSIVTKNSIEAVAAAAKLKSDGVKKVAFLAANDANGTSVSAAYTAALKDDGISVQAESYATTDLDMTAQLQRLQAGNPDILLLQAPAGGPAIGYILKGRTKIGWDIKTLGTTSVGDGNNLALTSSSADWKNLTLMVYPVNTQTGATKSRPEFKALVASLKQQGSKFDQLMQIYAAPWDSLMMAKLGIEQAKSDDAAKVAKALESIKQPKDKPYVEFETEQFTSSNHFLELKAADAFVYVQAGGVEQGIIQSK
jgi:branched-chain amino acid transport system substrate-binding protein